MIAALLAAALAAQLVAAPPPSPPAPVAAAPQTALDGRVADLIALANGGGNPAAMFTPEFLAQVPEAQVRTVLVQIASVGGKALRVERLDRAGARSATVAIAYERGVATFKLAVEPAAPFRIVGLLSLGIAAPETTLPAIANAFRMLPGQTGFALADLGEMPAVVLGSAPDRPLPIGSAFKLIILAELVRATAAGERHWDDVVTLDGRELPAGGYNRKPKGTQVTLRELAEKMISVSDNSATDVLLITLGRERIEAMQRMIGVTDPARNRPFLTTMEAFKLKGIPALRDPWLAGDEQARRALLPTVDAAATGPLKTLFADGRPVLIDRIEWFLSPADLIRTMDWLRHHTESGPGAEARRILAINPGISPTATAHYSYVGYKGGSEPGVINMTFLLQTKTGNWRVLTATWANPAAGIDTGRFASLVTRAAELAAD